MDRVKDICAQVRAGVVTPEDLLNVIEGIPEPDEVDFMASLDKTEVSNLLDGKGYVKLVDFGPRMVPRGRTPEFRIVQAARCSFGQGLKSVKADDALARYLMVNRHTSPLEMCSVTLLLRLPVAICTHFLRHRTGKFNAFSQRYAEVLNDEFYDPTKWEHGIRLQSKTNHQGSIDEIDEKAREDITGLMEQANVLSRQTYALYHQMIERGLAKEIARFWLPAAEYTTLYMQFDLNNLFKMLTLRADSHAQLETQVYANAIVELTRPLFPTLYRVWDDMNTGVALTGADLEAVRTGVYPDRMGRNEVLVLQQKCAELGLSIGNAKQEPS